MPDTRIPTFGELVKHYRVTGGLSVDDLARRTRLTAEAISIIESGSDLLPRAETVDRLADVFDLGGRERKLFKAVGLGKPVTDDLLPVRTQSDANMPSALYVFLIADVRGYTEFTQANGDMVATQLAARFAEIARDVVSAWEGRVIELRGDEVLAMFGSARKALQAAVALQERFYLATQENPHLPLPVGIGLDAGEAVPLEEGYRGAALNLAARLCALAGPGEVLTSEAVVHLARRQETLAYVDRGSVQLKGFKEPTQVLLVQRLPEGSEPDEITN